MEDVLTYVERQNYDPTHTTSLRNMFSRDMKRRFAELTIVIRKSVDVQDCFGLRSLQTMQMEPTGEMAFAFNRSAEKVEAFIRWLEQQIDKGILEIRMLQQVGGSVEQAWTNMYIYDSYKRGLLRARQELITAGYDVPPMDATEGIDIAMMNPFHMDRVGLLFTRVFNDLQGITTAMDAQISRILAQGMIDGDGPALLARKLISVINGTGVDKLGITDTIGRFIPASRRAMTLARTEIIRAHHLATIQEYRNWGVLGIKVKGEWKTAGDERVCSECAALEGRVFTLDAIEPMIPLHPQCRCIALPYIEELQKYKD